MCVVTFWYRTGRVFYTRETRVCVGILHRTTILRTFWKGSDKDWEGKTHLPLSYSLVCSQGKRKKKNGSRLLGRADCEKDNLLHLSVWWSPQAGLRMYAGPYDVHQNVLMALDVCQALGQYGGQPAGIYYAQRYERIIQEARWFDHLSKFS